MNIKKAEKNEVQHLSLREKQNTLREFATVVENEKQYNREAAQIAQKIDPNHRTPKNNVESAQVIKSFMENVDVSTLGAIFTTFGTIIVGVVNFYRYIKKFRTNMRNDVLGKNAYRAANAGFKKTFESNSLKEIHNSKEYKNLSESFKQSFDETVSNDNIEDVFANESKQFYFDSGYFMEALNSHLCDDMKFSLNYHKNNTNNYTEFLNSVKNFVETCGYFLSANDVENLKEHYSKYGR